MSNGKQKARASATALYKAEAVKDVADALGIANLSDSVASALASDVEYRIHQVVEEAARFMRHSRRTTLTTADIDNALRVLNIEPLYGHSAHNPPVFRRALPFAQMPSAGPVYFLEDEEIDFDRVLKEEKLALPSGVRWTAHWLAIEGVQPLIPENPPAVPRDDAPGPSRSGAPTSPGKRQQQQAALVKQVLSRELQLYYARLTSSLLPPTSDITKRTAALASLRHDAGLSALLPYLVRWVAEGVVSALKDGAQSDTDGRVLEVLMDVIAALLQNTSLLVEPYLHQLLPPILSTLLHSSLPFMYEARLRKMAASTLALVLTQHCAGYSSISSRIMKTLLLALVSPDKSRGTRGGAIHGLVAIGKEAVRKGLVEAGGARIIGAQSMPGEDSGLAAAVVDALKTLHPPSQQPIPFDPNSEQVARLREVLGDFFADRLMGDREWATGVLGEA
ncbi:TAF-domain-containing protein [Amylostereum chailletii]|nr:TAF-domain-containing protein [Amylostereum chailletii]